DPASKSDEISGRPFLPGPVSEEAFALIRSWMKACIKNHDKCQRTMSGAKIHDDAASVLPTRVIDVGGRDDTQTPRLIEANGLHRHYAILSHCWDSRG
ncbi:MAG: hypothetical protein M1830_005148, partial [Pleopsidium flavum]